MEKIIIVRYGEIGIKSYWVRREFEKILTDNISRALLENGVELEKIHQRGARVYIWCKPLSKALKVLRNVFGIVSYSPAYVIKTDINEMKKFALKLYKKNGGKFRISTRRRYKQFPLTSMQISAEVGAYIVEKAGAKVDLENYDVNISFEVNKKVTYVFNKFYKGWGGLPIGSQGKVVCVVSDKKESWVNTFLMARRGCEIVLAGIKPGIKNLAKKFEKKYYFCENELTFYNISKSKDILRGIIDVAKLENCKGIVLCEKFLGKLEGQTDLPVFYPSLGFEKKKINEIWKEMELD
jgi:thiamine biosynthesis protein ThiI